MNAESLVSVACLVVLMVTPTTGSASCTTLLSDSEFLADRWSSKGFYDSECQCPRFDCDSQQKQTGGDFYRTVSVPVCKKSSCLVGDCSEVYCGHFYSAKTYDPSVDGPIASLALSMKYKFTGGAMDIPGTGQVNLINFRFCLRQQDLDTGEYSYFGLRSAVTASDSALDWRITSNSGLHASDFSYALTASGGGFPDFTTNGGALEFGFLAYASFNANGHAFTTNGAVDDFSVEIRHNSTTIAATADAHGSINPSGTMVVECGSNQRFAITPDPGYCVADIQVDGRSTEADTSYSFSAVGAPHTIHATFTPPGQITAASEGHGSIAPSGTVVAPCLDDQVFAIEADPCYFLAGLTVDGSTSLEQTSTYSFAKPVRGMHTIVATFEGSDLASWLSIQGATCDCAVNATSCNFRGEMSLHRNGVTYATAAGDFALSMRGVESELQIALRGAVELTGSFETMCPPAYDLEFYLSNDEALDSGDQPLVTADMSTLRTLLHGSKTSVDVKWRVERQSVRAFDLATTKFILMTVDSRRRVEEQDERNNTSASRLPCISP